MNCIRIQYITGDRGTITRDLARIRVIDGIARVEVITPGSYEDFLEELEAPLYSHRNHRYFSPADGEDYLATIREIIGRGSYMWSVVES